MQPHTLIVLKQEYDAAVSLAFGLGVGMIISDLISLSGRFYYMGNPEVEGTLSIENGVYDSVPIEEQQSMAVIMFTAGFVF